MDRTETLEHKIRKFNRELREDGFLLTIIGVKDQTNTNIEFIGCLENEQHRDIVRHHISEICITMAGWE